jgi:predicted regulator of amino acid metabolism with ACT domain
MLQRLIDSLTAEQRAKLHEFGMTTQRITDIKHGRRLPTEVQVVALAEVCGVDRHDLQDEIALLRATPEQRTLIERVMRKSAGVAAAITLMVIVAFGSLTANGPTAFSRSR